MCVCVCVCFSLAKHTHSGVDKGQNCVDFSDNASLKCYCAISILQQYSST